MTTNTAKRAAWRAANRERIRAYDRARYAARPDAVKARAAAWRKQNKERARAIGARWRNDNRDAIRAAAKRRREESGGDHRRRRQLGVDQAAFAAMFARQGKRCAVCGRADAKKWTLDHSHATGIARGILCNSCNLGVGLLADSAQRCRAAADYLERHAQIQSLL